MCVGSCLGVSPGCVSGDLLPIGPGKHPNKVWNRIRRYAIGGLGRKGRKERQGRVGVCTVIPHCGNVWMPVGGCVCISICQHECLSEALILVCRFELLCPCVHVPARTCVSGGSESRPLGEVLLLRAG